MEGMWAVSKNLGFKFDFVGSILFDTWTRCERLLWRLIMGGNYLKIDSTNDFLKLFHKVYNFYFYLIKIDNYIFLGIESILLYILTLGS